MKVKELMELLKLFPSGAEVNVDDGELWPLQAARESAPKGIVILEYMGGDKDELTRIKRRRENEERAQRARNVMDAYSNEVGVDESNLCDLLADLMHRSFIDCEAVNFDEALRQARMHFEAESGQ